MLKLAKAIQHKVQPRLNVVILAGISVINQSSGKMMQVKGSTKSLGALNICSEFHNNSSNSCQDILLKTKKINFIFRAKVMVTPTAVRGKI